MTTLEPVFAIEADVWDDFVADFPKSHILQTSPWGALKRRFGWEDERIALSEGDELVAGAQILYRPLPAGMGRLAYVPKGPLVDWSDEEQVKALLAAIDRRVKSNGAIALTLEPDLLDKPRHRERLQALGFRRSPLGAIQPRRTLVVDIALDEEEDILMAMKSKTRYNIRLAGRKGVTVREAGEEGVSTFNELLASTAERAGFGIHPPGYYEAAYRLFSPRGWVRLLLAEVEGEAVAGLMVFALPSRSWYFYGASSTAHREKMPTYLIQWQAMQWARSIGCTTYDMWGVPDADREKLEDEFTERSDGLWGVYRFKRGFGGDLVRSVGAWDRVYALVRYRLYRWALALRDRLQETE